MKAFVKGLVLHHPRLFADEIGPLVDNYLDDIQFLSPIREKNLLQMLIAEYQADWLGVELNHEKRETPCSTTRHLGFIVKLNQKMVAFTEKHKAKILQYFDQFLAAIRRENWIPVKKIQKMLGLQIQIGTVFRVTRQYLMSTCDILRLTNGKRYFLPTKHKSLAARVVYDLMFRRRLIINSPMASFEYILSRTAVHDIFLASGASTSFSMAGVLIFGKENPKFKGFNGLFWQIKQTD